MIKCPVCQAKYPENTLFCGECGAYLPGGDGEETVTLTVAEVARIEREETSEIPGKEVASPLYLKLKILDSGHNVEVPLTREEVSIGRLDPSSDSFPDVDLAAYGGVEKGVSRHHVRIIRRGNEVLIEDLGSINGTFLNRKKLSPYFPQVLKNGDKLQLGRLKLRVSFK